MMFFQIGQWGNSLGLRIPSFLSDKLGLKKGTAVNIYEADGRIIIEKKETLEDLLKGNMACPYGEIETGNQIGKEEW